MVRADLNIPIKNGKIKDEYKIHKSLPTIKFLIEKGAKIIVVSHLGRPKKADKSLSLLPIAKYVARYLSIKLIFCKDLASLSKTVSKMKDGDVTFLENIRFNKGEEENDPCFAKTLASHADLFVLDGFAVAHRGAASVSGVAKFLPAYAGLLLEEEIEGLSRVLEKPKKPFVLILGGAKMETKVPILKKLLPFADHVLIGGGIGNTYLSAKGFKIGRSLVEKKFGKEILKYAKKKKVVMPVDVIVGKKNGKNAKAMSVQKGFGIRDNGYGIYDIGPETIKLFAKYIKQAETLVWNGAMGYFEQFPYQYGTYTIARLVASRSKGRAFGACGGGETVEILQKLDLMYEIDLVSTGGGAMLAFLSGKKLPGVEAVGKKIVLSPRGEGQKVGVIT
ncbi:MAG: Phosphoglycerate kinase [Candidatus Magasanikbacteria bacterium GW2011_GWA2_46_17]|uniref:Phosphoglycerate kinase n=1 Tax=Candidatus Magasanikbacteria bacterium GW2011_GWA2_46_17 TaxID=1619042 RepID=A0A0G1RAV7_9BACT|nr:MAG: Phosphoglycerate kinase [Candidatus Magasanikbacteria bacterium GW2011_GWA2_46_17]